MFTKGKLEYTVLNGTQIPATLFIKPDDGIDVDIAVFEKWEQDWAKKEMLANAQELVRRWNSYEGLLAACEAVSKLVGDFRPDEKTMILVEAAISQAKD